MRRARAALAAVAGLSFGFFLTASGLGDYDTIHQGLLLADPYIFLMLGSVVGSAALPLWWLRRRGWVTPLAGRMRLPADAPGRHHLYGGALFGAGMAVTTVCPGITVAMTATGGLYGLVVLAGLLAGLSLRDRVSEARTARPNVETIA